MAYDGEKGVGQQNALMRIIPLAVGTVAGIVLRPAKFSAVNSPIKNNLFNVEQMSNAQYKTQ